MGGAGACQSNRLPARGSDIQATDQFVIVYDYMPGNAYLEIVEGKRALRQVMAGHSLSTKFAEAVQGFTSTALSTVITPANIIPWLRMARISIDFRHCARIWSA